MQAERAAVIFQVSSLEASISFYVAELGFEKVFEYGDPAFYAGVKMNEVTIHLCAGKENVNRVGMGAVYIFCDEVDSFYKKIEQSEVVISSKLESLPYEMRDFQIKDIDGNLVSFGCPV